MNVNTSYSTPEATWESDEVALCDIGIANNRRNFNVIDFVLPDGATPITTSYLMVDTPVSRPIKSDDYIQALSELGYEFRLNEMNDTTEVNGKPISDPMRAKIRTDLRDAGFPHVNIAEDAWISNALKNSYHPIKEYLNSLEYDGGNHIDSLASYFIDAHSTDEGKDPCPIFHLYIKRWLIGAVAKVFDNQQNMMLVLDGPQGIGKSFLGRWLAGTFLQQGYYIESPIHPDDKDHQLRLISKVIWEVSELGSTTRRQDVDALKAFITTTNVTVRAPYGRYDIQKPALASFIGTVNDLQGFLTDATGNRRFMVCTLREINWDYAQNVRFEQVWAEAVDLYRNGEPWQLTEEEQRMQSELNRHYEVDSGLLDWITKHYVLTGTDDGFVPTHEIAMKLQDQGYRSKNTETLQREIGIALIKAGLRKTQRRTDVGRPTGYCGIRAIT